VINSLVNWHEGIENLPTVGKRPSVVARRLEHFSQSCFGRFDVECVGEFWERLLLFVLWLGVWNALNGFCPSKGFWM